MKVQEALTEVMRALPAIGKDGRGPKDQGGYAYRGIEQITREVQPLLAKHGIVIAPKATLVSVQPAPGMKETWTTTILSVQWVIIGPEGDAIEAQTIGVGHDSSDKGANKCMSQAFKYLLLDLFCISDAKDDSDGHDYSSGVASRPRSNPQPQVETAGLALYKRLKDPMSDASKTKLKEIAGTYQLKLTANDLDANPEYANEVRLILDGAPRSD